MRQILLYPKVTPKLPQKRGISGLLFQECSKVIQKSRVMSASCVATVAPVILDNVWKSDGTNFVRLRFTLRREKKYLRTNVLVKKSNLDKKGNISDVSLREKVEGLVNSTQRILSDIDTEALPNMSLDDVVKYVQRRHDEAQGFKLDFLEFCDQIISEKTGQSQKTYRSAINSFKQFLKKDKLDISGVTSTLLRQYQRWLEAKHGEGARAVSAYTNCLSFIHGQARLRYNDEETGVVRIKNPFQFYKPAHQKQSKHRSVDVDLIQKMIDLRGELRGREKLGVDVFLISFALMDMNAPDLYTCAKPQKGVIHYNRTKTRSRREDGAEMFVKIDKRIQPIMEEYLAESGEFSFKFKDRYTTYLIFGQNVNAGLRHFTKRIGFDKRLTLYCARHSWASIAYQAGVNKSLINDGLCHVDRDMKVTDIYIKKDWSVLWNANAQVLDMFKWK